MGQTTGVVVRGGKVYTVLGLNGPKFSQKLMNVADLFAEDVAGSGGVMVFQNVSVIFQNRTAPTCVADNGVEASHAARQCIKRAAIAGCQFSRIVVEAGVLVEGATAALSARNVHIATVVLKNTGRGEVDLRMERIRGATE
jgi:hypothetical protein